MGKVKITFVGDIFPANLHYTIGFGVASEFYKHRGKPWVAQLQSFFKDNDIVFGNLESPLIDDELFTTTNCFAGSYEFAPFLKQIGVNIVSIANNHILEQGLEGFQSTIDYLEKNQIHYVGKITNGASNIVTIKWSDIKIGFAGFNDIHDIPNPDLYANYKEESVLKALYKMDEMNLDYKIISIHWGDEFINFPSLKQIESAHKFIENGADIIVGHHPHVVQPIEKFKNGLIFYSLGNFIFDMIWSKNVRRGIIVKVILEKGKDIIFDIVPICIGRDYIPYNNNKKEIEKIFIGNSSLLDNYSAKEYCKLYEKKQKFNLSYQRIMMKLFLLKNLKRLSPQTKSILYRKLHSKIKIK